MSTDISRMMDLLRERSAAAAISVNNQVSTDRTPIKWLKKSANVIESDDSAYQIERRYAQTRVCSDSCGYIYLVFRKGPTDKLLGMYPDPEQAKAACETDKWDREDTCVTNPIPKLTTG